MAPLTPRIKLRDGVWRCYTSHPGACGVPECDIIMEGSGGDPYEAYRNWMWMVWRIPPSEA